MFDIHTRRAPVRRLISINGTHWSSWSFAYRALARQNCRMLFKAGSTVRAVLGLGQSRQQQRGQDRNDRDDHQQLDQREAADHALGQADEGIRVSFHRIRQIHWRLVKWKALKLSTVDGPSRFPLATLRIEPSAPPPTTRWPAWPW